MAVGLKVKYYWYSIGHGDFLHSFFSTVSYHLEPNGWGTKYPLLLNKLYNGKLEYKYIKDVIKEIDEIQESLKNYSPSQVVWDIEDLSKTPPWGDNISDEITDLSNYFVTSDGEDLITILQKALNKALKIKSDIEIESI
ncbi:immunity protein 70 of polymorphic toxin system [Aeribacillus composti]|uniref:immunity 70 family protein n=1 Tax=Aeribacillus composti TaxID=1868734 RepID=UPI00119C7F43|nr:immunity 70 family protein [Aeribacillus composti]TVZ87697.1 immunity protein 70 of polymorphic toxin system [Aeribacillus composti]